MALPKEAAMKPASTWRPTVVVRVRRKSPALPGWWKHFFFSCSASVTEHVDLFATSGHVTSKIHALKRNRYMNSRVEKKRTWTLDEIIVPQNQPTLVLDLPLNFPLS